MIVHLYKLDGLYWGGLLLPPCGVFRLLHTYLFLVSEFVIYYMRTVLWLSKRSIMVRGWQGERLIRITMKWCFCLIAYKLCLQISQNQPWKIIILERGNGFSFNRRHVQLANVYVIIVTKTFLQFIYICTIVVGKKTIFFQRSQFSFMLCTMDGHIL